jgi:hypothetical protein
MARFVAASGPQEIDPMKARFRRNVFSKERQQEIDLSLAVMCALQYPGQRVKAEVINEITGMSHGGAHAIIQRALMKLRKRISKKLVQELTT